MPRRRPKLTLWQRFLALLGLGPASGTKKSPARTKGKQSAPSNGPDKSRGRATVTKKRTGPKKPKSPKPKRTPERVEVTSPRLYIGNLSYDATESDLVELFKGVGTVANVEVVYNPRTQRSKGYAFIDMQSLDEALRAVDELHDQEYMGRKMVVSGAKDPKKREEAQALG